MSTIPERKETFRAVADCIMNRQMRPIERLIVYLHRYGTIDPVLPTDPRIEYRVESDSAGPWVRYRPADELEDADILVTLDDDTHYPEDYVQRGVAALEGAGVGWAVTFGGILWDPLAQPHTYTGNCWRFLASRAQDRDRTVAFHMGLVSFFRVRDVRGIVHLPLAGFNTNDDMMVAWGLQSRGVSIRCLARPAGWILDLTTATAPHALYRRDVDTRYRTFREMVERLGFDPTAGELRRFRELPRRILVLATNMPSASEPEGLDQALRGLCAQDASVHLLAPVPNSRVPEIMFRANAPYELHAVAVPEPGGRLDSLLPVRAWRNWRVHRAWRRTWDLRERLARQRLQPTEAFRWAGGRLQREAKGR